MVEWWCRYEWWEKLGMAWGEVGEFVRMCLEQVEMSICHPGSREHPR